MLYLFISAGEHPWADAYIDSLNQKSEILPIDNAGGPSFWKPFFLLALHTPIAGKFEEGMQIDTQATGYITSVANYLKLRKLKIADGHHFENGNVIRYSLPVSQPL